MARLAVIGSRDPPFFDARSGLSYLPIHCAPCRARDLPRRQLTNVHAVENNVFSLSHVPELVPWEPTPACFALASSWILFRWFYCRPGGVSSAGRILVDI